jgi:hypothetical protein
MTITTLANFAVAVLFLTIPLAALLMLPGAVWRLYTRQRPRRGGGYDERLLGLAFVLSCFIVALAL